MSEFEQWTVDKPWLDIRCSLGEGPFYEKETNSVRFVDIKKKQLHTVSVTEGQSSLKSLEFDVAVTVTCDIEGVDPQDRILIGLKHGLALLDRKTGNYDIIAEFKQPRDERLRSNDGAADPLGNFWLGTMSDFGYDLQPEGSLLYYTSGTLKEVVDGLSIPNSVGWSPDNRTFYFTHSTAREVIAFDYDPATGGVSNKRVFYQHEGPGEPDGFRVDVDGNIWHAVYGESRVLKISPQGKLVGQINLPTRNITCVQFVGTELVITTASDEEGDAKSQENGGAVFRVDVGVAGLDLFKYRA
ncbi:hypothetical protein S40285_02030 [Stachybotrys chlorohalonatus IBT 40285]|uniref:SMP-30/Gluconolactonase/LRE-like region domain-containing protein n=1 Tax=Stachybotrys chlorohalonatus (strain IBT 40285) TaxID=1283841 RepID=A0A084R1E1_STAC4|nr:hypothetical protein S40285_02030 [Stachybotrys chlorohalonata IBT 40285]